MPEDPVPLTARPAALGLLWPDMAPPFDVQSFLESPRIQSGLARAVFNREGRRWTAGQWIQEQAARHRINPKWLLVVLQGEQSLVKERRPLSPDFKIEKSGPPPAGFKAPPVDAPGVRYVRTKGGWYRVTGTWRMMAATGYGIPDPNTEPPWDTGDKLGFPAQVAGTASMAARDIRAFYDAQESGQPVPLTLYPTAAEKAAAAAEGRKPKGETIVAGDPLTYLVIRYTPSLDALDQRTVSIPNSLFGTEA
jgi:hypothetical protein